MEVSRKRLQNNTDDNSGKEKANQIDETMQNINQNTEICFKSIKLTFCNGITHLKIGVPAHF